MISYHETVFHGLRVKDYDENENLKDPDKYAWRITSDWDEASVFKKRFMKFLNDPLISRVRAFIIGDWGDVSEYSPDEYLDLVVENKDNLKNLRALFVGDITQEECDISWITQGFYREFLNAFPLLEELRIRGAGIMDICGHPSLKMLTIETGGMKSNIINDLKNNSFPELTSLELWLGKSEEGFDGDINTIKSFIRESTFPKLKNLGLKRSEIADEIAVFLAKSRILEKIDTLDLSHGILTDKGGHALVNSERISELKKLDLSYHLMSKKVVKEFNRLKIECDVTSWQDDEDDYRISYIRE